MYRRRTFARAGESFAAMAQAESFGTLSIDPPKSGLDGHALSVRPLQT
jgi:hypothetical protein